MKRDNFTHSELKIDDYKAWMASGEETWNGQGAKGYDNKIYYQVRDVWLQPLKDINSRFRLEWRLYNYLTHHSDHCRFEVEGNPSMGRQIDYHVNSRLGKSLCLLSAKLCFFNLSSIYRGGKPQFDHASRRPTVTVSYFLIMLLQVRASYRSPFVQYNIPQKRFLPSQPCPWPVFEQQQIH